MQVQTALGVLDVACPGQSDRDAEVCASAVRLCARDMPAVVGKLPNGLRSAGRLLARSACGDRGAKAALSAVSAHDAPTLVVLQAQLPDLREAPPEAIGQASAMMQDDLRGPQGRLARALSLVAQGRAEEAASMNASGWAARLGSGGGAPVASVGALRAHTGCTCPVSVLSAGSCTCGAMP